MPRAGGSLKLSVRETRTVEVPVRCEQLAIERRDGRGTDQHPDALAYYGRLAPRRQGPHRPHRQSPVLRLRNPAASVTSPTVAASPRKPGNRSSTVR